MRYLEYYSEGKLRRVRFTGVFETVQKKRGRSLAARRAIHKPQALGGALTRTMKRQAKRLSTRFRKLSEATTLIAPTATVGTTVVPTETVAIDGARVSEVRWMRSHHGMEIVREGRHGKVLMKAPDDSGDGIVAAFAGARALQERGNVGAAHPNFLRVVQRPGQSSRHASSQWALDNPGSPGVIGADVHALAAWTITEGDSAVRVAVLDEGVDTLHPHLRDSVAAEADFVDGNDHARPNGNDAHGTACAGIVVGKRKQTRGLARGVRLVAARIAKSDSQGFWIFDDFETADAIDWCWDDAKSDVLSNSWGGGHPADVISRAFERARTRGRAGKGAVIVIAAGNDQAEVDFPGNLPEMMTVGASNQWDKRKTRTSEDGENWWGSNFGDALDLMAPGVSIRATDIRGNRGYSSGLVTPDFNGTSSAAPHVAAAAALILSVKPTLDEYRVREILNETTDPLPGGKRLVGHGRLNVYAALRAARRE
ncbi:MAG: S8 family serine peptidase [Acidobacteriota bacterium]|nr:S8 family serine peptidase [Acidobacteriota bacterium]